MTPATRVALAALTAVAAGLLMVTAFSDHWFHAPYSSMMGDINWDGFGGPSTRIGDGLTLADVVSVVAGLSTLLGPLCGLLVAFGTIAGRRRDHVPRLPALLGAIFAFAALLFQAISIAMWPIGEQPEPRGFGWAMPAFFVAGVLFAAAIAALWRDASKRARASADALARVNRELAARDLATIPESEPEEPPVERV